jgi:ribosome biogenesis GTPase / thiamine phosphate phosphatase
MYSTKQREPLVSCLSASSLSAASSDTKSQIDELPFSGITMDHNFTHTQGIVYKKNKGSYVVHANGRAIACNLSTRLWKEMNQTLAKECDIAVGDIVQLTDSQDGQSTITQILPRRNRLARRSAVPMPGAHTAEQVIVANVDQVVPVFAAANPPPRWNLLDRYLVTAESLELPALICFTKLDLAMKKDGSADAELLEVVAEYRRIGYRVTLVSAHTGEGLDELKEALLDRTSVFLGKSGVGKTSLLNALQPGLGQRINEVSQVTGKGKHTTTHMEMFPLEIGGAIVDTPGVREFGLWDVDADDLALFFPEIRPYVGRCRFGLDCQHDEEPGCAVRKAVMANQISPRRYQSYLRLKAE